MQNNARTTQANSSGAKIYLIILAIFLAPIGLVASLITLMRSKNHRAVVTARISLVISVLLLYPLIFTADMFFQFLPNPAAERVAPITKALESMGGKKILHHSYNGHGPSATPWYDVTYLVPDNDQLNNRLVEAAKESRFDISAHRGIYECSGYFNPGPGSENLRTSYGGANSLSIDIYRGTAPRESCHSTVSLPNGEVEIYVSTLLAS